MSKKFLGVLLCCSLFGLQARTVEDLYDYAIGAYGMHTSYGLARS